MRNEYARTDTPPKKVEKKIIYQKQRRLGYILYPWLFALGLILCSIVGNALVEFLAKLF